jgi:hypothetical protein
MENSEFVSLVQHLHDRQLVTDVLHRYCRGVDRCDAAELRGVFWPDAGLEYSPGQLISPEDFIAWGLPMIKPMRTAHRLSNILIDFTAPDRARSESYMWAYHSQQSPDGTWQAVVPGCRYLDALEKRTGQWRILRRKVVMDFALKQPAAADMGFLGALQVTGRKDHDDPLYQHLAAD